MYEIHKKFKKKLQKHQRTKYKEHSTPYKKKEQKKNM